MITEKRLEQKLVEAVRKRSGEAFKFVSPGHAGVPDRLVVIPSRTEKGSLRAAVGFVEVKKPGGGQLSRLQGSVLRFLSSMGAKCYILNDSDQIDSIVSDILSDSKPQHF